MAVTEFGSTNRPTNPNLRQRGAIYDYNDPQGINKKLSIYFPYPKGEPLPDGAEPGKGSLDDGGKTATAIFAMWVNPDQLQIKYPTRSQVVQTLGGLYIDSFGYGAPVGTLSGSFGWGFDNNVSQEKRRTGLDRMGTLRQLYYGWQQLTTTIAAPCQIFLIGNARTSNLNLKVHLGDLEITRSKSSPFVINYSLSFTVLRDYDGPDLLKVLPPVGKSLSSGDAPPPNPDRQNPNT